MKKVIFFLTAAILFGMSRLGAQDNPNLETFFKNNKNAEFDYEAGAMDVGSKGTAKVASITGNLITLDLTSYAMGPDYFNKVNAKESKLILEFKLGDYFLKGKYPKKGKVYSNSLNLDSDAGDWIHISLVKENNVVQEEKTIPEKKEIAYLKIKNIWKNTYINIEKGLTCSNIDPRWYSAMWEIEPIAGTPNVRIKNRWKNTYLNIESGSVQCSAIQPRWSSAIWVIEKIAGTNQVRIKNVWKNTYLNIESGNLQCTAIQSKWSSAKWVLEYIVK